MRRFIVFDRQLRPLFDLDGRVTEATRYERINGEHKLDVRTTQPLAEGMRILVRDGTLKWREWVVDEPDESKDGTNVVEGSYGCTWSVQYDLSTVSGGELWPGTYEPITAGAALAMVLAAQSRWEVGRVTVATMAGTSLYDGSVWDYLGKLQEVWGGEVEPRVEVDSDGVTHRCVDWLAHVGSEDATRRFDYGEDCTRIARKPPVGPMCCRIVPRGGRDATDGDGVSYSERVGVEEEPYSEGDGWVHDAGSIWVRDPEAEELFRTPNPDGTWRYPERVVTYDTDDPEELLQLAAEDIHRYTRPSPTYEADVLQFAAAGMDAHGVALGDAVHVVDREFGDAPLRIEARIVEMTVNELDESDVQLVIGEATRGIESAFKSMRSAIDEAEERTRRIEGAGTIAYVEKLLDAINAEINGTGGYGYLVPGEGIITYDRRVADPLIGTEATYVTQMKGGSVRFANSKKPSFAGIDDWNWTTVITPSGFLGLAATIAAITTGYIGSAGDTYIDLDNHTAQLGQTSGPHMDIDSSGMQIYDGATSLGFFGAESGTSIARVGQALQGNVVMSGEGYVDVRNGSTVMAHFGYGEGANSTGGTSVAPYYSIGIRNASGAIGNYSIAEGYNTIAAGCESHAEGYFTKASNSYAHAEGFEATANGYASHAEGNNTTASGNYSHAEGDRSSAGGYASHAEGFQTTASGDYSHAEGSSATASGDYSHAEGYTTTASGDYSHAEGYTTTASGDYSHAEGRSATAGGSYSHAEGYLAKANSAFSHAEGYDTTANSSSNTAHAEGNGTTASGPDSHAEGYETTASGRYSHASGLKTIASYDSQFVCGKYNATDSTAIFIVGSGNENARINSFCVGSSSAYFFSSLRTGTVYVNGSSVHSSDRRLKDHVAYLGEDASDFIRALRPIRYRWKNGDGEHYGFYAQDVREADPHDTETVVEGKHDESLGFDPLTLDYNALISPLVAYAQGLERRVEAQDKTIADMQERLATLEARP